MTLVVVLVVVALGAFVSWDRWLRYDDAADIQGTWVVEGSPGSITITDTRIDLAPDASLSYAIDPFAKTLTYSLGETSGTGRYRFSADRSQIAFTDGETSWFDTFSSDLTYAVSSAFSAIFGGDAPSLGENESSVVLTRTATGVASSNEDVASNDGDVQAGADLSAGDGEGANAEETLGSEALDGDDSDESLAADDRASDGEDAHVG